MIAGLLRRDAAPLVALGAMVAASAVAGVWLAWRPIDHLIAQSVSDDAFYYFQTARTISEGGGVSVDGEVWGNGFHPLWLLMLVPVYAAGAGDEQAIHIALTLSAVAVSVSGALLYATARRLAVSPLASLIVVAVYLASPAVVYLSINGLETGVNLVAFVALLYAFVACWQEPSRANELLVSVAAGAVVLSRTDYGVAALFVLAALALRANAHPASLAALAGPAIVLTAPWFAWNIAVFDSPVQGSAGAIPYVLHELYPAPDASAREVVRHSLEQLQGFGYDVLPYVYFAPDLDDAHVAAAAVVCLIAGAVVAIIVPRGVDRSALVLLGVPALGLAVQFLIHGGVRWYVREWYLAGVFPVLALALAVVLDELWRWRAGVVASAAVLALIVAASAAKSRATYSDGWYGLQTDMLEAARWIDTETPPDARVGAFNSGIIGYFSNRTTVNLDGVMNPDALDAIKDRRVVAYMQERRITYLADFPYYPYWLYRPFLGGELAARERARFDANETFQGPVVVYELTRAESPAGRPP